MTGESENREELFGRLLERVVLSPDEPDDESVDAILVIYKLYCTPQCLVNKLMEFQTQPKKQSNNRKVTITVSKILIRWARIEHSKFIVNTLLDLLPHLITPNEMNCVKLALLAKYKAQKPYRIAKADTLRSSYLHYNAEIFHGYSPKVVAQALTLIDWTLFVGIKQESVLRKGWQRDDRHKVAPALTKLAERFDKMSFWIASQILFMRPIEKQAKLLTFLIRVMKCLVDYRNHQSAQQILSGLNMASVQRLKQLWPLIPFKRREIFEEIDELFSPIGNHAKYRETISRIEAESEPCIPYIAMYLRDIVYVIDGNPEFTPQGEINFDRSKLLAQQTLRLLRFQNIPYNFEVPDALLSYLFHLRGPILSEEELWDLSLEHQPLATESSPDLTLITPDISKDPTPISLQEVIREPLLCNGFRKFLTAENGAEYLCFIRDLHRYLALQEDHRARKLRAREISHLYLQADSQLLVQLFTAEEREQFSNVLERSTQPAQEELVCQFRDAAEELLSIKLRDFVKHSLFKSCQDAMECINAEEIRDAEQTEESILSDRDWAFLLEKAEELTLPNETVLVKQGTHHSTIYRLKSGMLRIEQADANGTIILSSTIDKPVLIGEMSIFNVTKATASVIVHGGAVLYSLEAATFRSKLMPDPGLGLRFYKHIGKQLADILTKVSAVKRDKTRGRTVKRLQINTPAESEPESGDSSQLQRQSSLSSLKDQLNAETPAPPAEILARFQLENTEELLGSYHCKSITGVVHKQVDLFITTSHVCCESRIFGQRSKEVFPASKIVNTFAILDKNTITISTKSKKRKFVLRPEDMLPCYKLLEVLCNSQKKMHRLNWHRLFVRTRWEI